MSWQCGGGGWREGIRLLSLVEDIYRSTPSLLPASIPLMLKMYMYIYLENGWRAIGWANKRLTLFLPFYCRWMYQKPKRPIAKARSAASTPRIRWLSIKQERHHCMRKESGVTIRSRPVMVDRPSQCSTKRQRLQRRLCFVSSASNAKPPICTQSNAASISRLEEKRRQREDCTVRHIIYL